MYVKQKTVMMLFEYTVSDLRIHILWLPTEAAEVIFHERQRYVNAFTDIFEKDLENIIKINLVIPMLGKTQEFHEL